MDFGLPGSQPLTADDVEMCPKEAKLLNEVTELKKRLRDARRKVADTDFFRMTEKMQELGRLKYSVRRHLRGHLAKVSDMQWAMDSQLMVSAAQDGKLIVWDTHSANKMYMIGLDMVWVMACAYQPSMDFVASGGLDNQISLFALSSLESASATLSKRMSGHDGYISALRYVDDSKMLSCSGDKTCALWDLNRGERTEKFLGHTNDVTSIAVPKKDQNIFVSVSSDKICRVWDLRSNKCVQYHEGHEQDVNGVEFFPDSKMGFVTSSDDGSCRLWDLRADQAIAVYIDEYITCGSTSVAISKSGRVLLAGYDDFNGHVWDMLREERVGMLSGHDGRISRIAVCESGAALATASWDTTCLIWTLKS